jgi:hypothetical protein
LAAQAERDAAGVARLEAVAEAERVAAEAEALRAESQDAVAMSEQQLAEALAALEKSEAAIAEATEAERLASEALAAQRQAERERRMATLAAHRGLIVDALGRMVRRECEQARGKQATPEKLRRWMAHFPSQHEGICIEALLPAVRTHLTGTTDDPVAVTTALVREHIALFTAQVRSALDTDPEDFHPVLERVLARWESDRAGQVADALLVEAMRHVND